jgi:xanthine dehydrogenase YagR molybdenum-binding subunit
VPLRFVEPRIASSKYPIAPSSGGSMTTHNTAPAIRQAGEDAKAKLLARIAEQRGVDAGDLDVVDGIVTLDGDKYMPWDEACRLIAGESLIGRGRWDRQALARDESTGHEYGAQLARVEVDAETGVVRVRHIVAIQACGRVVVRKTAENQIIGGVLQGVSYALWEDKILDRQLGAMVNPNLEMYKIIGAADAPHIEPILWRKGQTGERSLGEPPTIPTAGAVACAVYNAVGAPVRHLPLTPDKVLVALQGGAA